MGFWSAVKAMNCGIFITMPLYCIAQSYDTKVDLSLVSRATDIPTAYTRLQELATVLQASQASFTKISGLSLFTMMS